MFKYLSICIFLICGIAQCQTKIDSVLSFALKYRGLNENDITIPVNFDKEKSPFNDSKLLLPVVRDLMKEPLKSFEFSAGIDSVKDLDLINAVKKLWSYKSYNPQKENASIPDFRKMSSEDLFKYLVSFVKRKKDLKEKLLSLFTEEELVFLQKNLMSLISETDSDDGSNMNIFKFNRARDSSIAVSKRTLDILNNKNFLGYFTENIIDAQICLSIFEALSESGIKFGDTEFIDNSFVKGEFYFYYDKGGIRIAAGGKDQNIYSGSFDFIIDMGGDDIYKSGTEKKGSKPFSFSRFNCIIDISGNDFYSSESSYSLAGAVFNSSFIFDKEGDDIYKGKNVSLGSAICGLGILYDLSGNDTYQANQFSIGAATFGVGILADRSGNDVYIANSYSQGFGMTEGIGAIIDNRGNDSYLIDARSLDIGRYEDHYISMSQGFGLGLRPYYAGGIGLILEGEGNDIYNTDIFGQGGAYWYSLGCITDVSGNDKYNSYQYSQGAGIHLAVGILKDLSGWDFYSSNGVSQGCGHDFGFGLLFDAKGNDNYSAYSLSQGAGNANGIGIFFDKSGRDGYLNKELGNTRGYGNSRREFGSLGIFADASGEDFYSIGGLDSVISKSSMWGVMTDYFFTDQTATSGSQGFKVPLDSSVEYTKDEYFIMAKTLEPRFSLWQEYGFRKLAEDSVNTSEFILKYLNTEDHRAGLVLRNLAFRIGYTMGNMFVDKLNYHLQSAKAKPVFDEYELAFICYLFGETRNPAGRMQLLELTKDENIRVRTSAVNALGKIKIDSTEKDFISVVSERLREIASEKSQFKMINKDIAYAFKNYKDEKNIPVLIEMTGYDYFGVRFLAADDLKDFGDTYYSYIDKETLVKVSENTERFSAFLMSIENLSDENIIDLLKRIEELNIYSDDVIQLSIINLLEYKKSLSENEFFKIQFDKYLSTLQSDKLLNVRE